jgi:hypothetical protein
LLNKPIGGTSKRKSRYEALIISNMICAARQRVVSLLNGAVLRATLQAGLSAVGKVVLRFEASRRRRRRFCSTSPTSFRAMQQPTRKI